MLGGFTQMSVSIVALVEASFDLTIVPVLMLAVCVAMIAARNITQ